VGALLAKRWGLPETIVAAIQGHHDADASQKDPLVAVVVVANELSRAVLEKKPLAIAKRVAPETLELLGLDLERVLEVGREVGERLDELAL
jgi:HD-like signal output (HDOD) protein